MWYENGQKRQERSFRDGHAEGPTTEWYESGSLMKQEMWKAGKAHGPYSNWFENGQKREEGRFERGYLVELLLWDEEGNELPSPDLPEPPPERTRPTM